MRKSMPTVSIVKGYRPGGRGGDDVISAGMAQHKGREFPGESRTAGRGGGVLAVRLMLLY